MSAAQEIGRQQRIGIRQYQVDAFTDRAFSGNPAAVCLLDRPLADPVMQLIAAENNLSETAFVVSPAPEQASPCYALRWFTPTVEVPLCGHATLASAHVLAHEEQVDGPIRFDTASGRLTVTPLTDSAAPGYQMDFPAYTRAKRQAPLAAVEQVLDCRILEYVHVEDGHGWNVAMLDSAERVRGLRFDPSDLLSAGIGSLIVTAPADPTGVEGCDFVSRVFVPGEGIHEDPVTGSAHCALTPFWAERLRKTDLRARQVSARGGSLVCRLRDDRVLLEGQAVTVVSGTLWLPQEPTPWA